MLLPASMMRKAEKRQTQRHAVQRRAIEKDNCRPHHEGQRLPKYERLHSLTHQGKGKGGGQECAAALKQERYTVERQVGEAV